MTSTLNRVGQLKALATLLRRENTVSLATVNERGEACVAPLFYLVDEKLSLFWLSSPTSSRRADAGSGSADHQSDSPQTAHQELCRAIQVRRTISSDDEPLQLV